MTPTNKLRFVERLVPMTDGMGKPVRVLQQWFAPFRTFYDGYGCQTVEQEGGEWRDVPLEEEAK